LNKLTVNIRLASSKPKTTTMTSTSCQWTSKWKHQKNTRMSACNMLLTAVLIKFLSSTGHYIIRRYLVRRPEYYIIWRYLVQLASTATRVTIEHSKSQVNVSNMHIYNHTVKITSQVLSKKFLSYQTFFTSVENSLLFYVVIEITTLVITLFRGNKELQH